MKRSFCLVDLLLVLALFSDVPWLLRGSSYCNRDNSADIRPHSVTITEFGAVGDGVTLNTKAFQNAIFYLNSFSDKGGAKLFVPAGRWLTGSFDLISHLTLWLDKDAVILGSTNSDDWPVVDPLPSYGRGRELPGKRHRSLIYGHNLTDVVITGDNGTIDGQGSNWWGWFRKKTLNYTRPHLVELMNSSGIVISNLTFTNSPFWTIHPVYCSHVIVKNVTIRAPLDSPNTDGIDPDSSDDVCIEDCDIRTGDDLISIKSGWDEYGTSYNRPSRNITIHRLVGQTRSSSGIAIGSEMSGGVSDVHAENLQFYNSKTAIRFTGLYGEHPDEHYDPKALPIIEKITIEDVKGNNIKHAGIIEGIEADSFRDICLSNISLNVTSKSPWNCSNIQGYSDSVTPEACEPLREGIYPHHSSDCYYLSSQLLNSGNRNREN
ncbi:Pectin lyase-like superfamily protein [Euphorbia peplus]|nr:Pectin lyase-like superfamily protein [Euphorbia peplus]